MNARRRGSLRRTPPLGEPPDPRVTAARKQLEREELSRLFGRLVVVRLLALPLALALGGWLVWKDPSHWRRVMLVGTVAAVSAFFVLEWLVYRARGLGPASFSRNLSMATAGQLLVSFASGGIESPFLTAAIPIGVLTSLCIGPRAQLLLPLLQVVSIWGMAALAATGAIPDLNLAAFGGGPRVGADTAHVWAHAAMLSFILVATQFIGRAFRTSFEAGVVRQLAANQESLRAHQERAEELTALSGEIAHELKNPLASVKGLAGLLAQQHLPKSRDAKGAERLAVLRHEVDRMQSILDEFLNFSRPLVPLALGQSDIAATCREVAALHEGLANERGVALAVRGADSVPVRCDPRKVKQVLINLVQNALDASARGGEVALEAAPLPGGGARVRVLDRGRGVEPAVGESIFLPGFTTKPNGSGLGLTIARSLARQHGGELALLPRDGGGTAAELILPAPSSGIGAV
jgi:two-component system, NtrC family, sensor histidine kinase HydH